MLQELARFQPPNRRTFRPPWPESHNPATVVAQIAGCGGPSARDDRRLICRPVVAQNLDPALTGGVFSSGRAALAVRRQLQRVADLRAARAGALLLDAVARVGLRHAVAREAVVDHQRADVEAAGLALADARRAAAVHVAAD